MKFAFAWKLGGLRMTNLFGFRATDPRIMKKASDPIGPGNDAALLTSASFTHANGGIVLAAWGTHGTHQGRGIEVTRLLHEAGIPVHCLKTTKEGHPWHPLYLKSTLEPRPYRREPQKEDSDA